MVHRCISSSTEYRANFSQPYTPDQLKKQFEDNQRISRRRRSSESRHEPFPWEDNSIEDEEEAYACIPCCRCNICLARQRNHAKTAVEMEIPGGSTAETKASSEQTLTEPDNYSGSWVPVVENTKKPQSSVLRTTAQQRCRRRSATTSKAPFAVYASGSRNGPTDKKTFNVKAAKNVKESALRAFRLRSSKKRTDP